jgi:hypothetical protein
MFQCLTHILCSIRSPLSTTGSVGRGPAICSATRIGNGGRLDLERGTSATNLDRVVERYVRIRHFGSLASAHRTARLAGQPRPDPRIAISQLATWRCSRCGANMCIGPQPYERLKVPFRVHRSGIFPLRSLCPREPRRTRLPRG